MSNLMSQDLVLNTINSDECWSIVHIINGYAVIADTSLLRTVVAGYIDSAGSYRRIVTVAVRCCNSCMIHSSLQSCTVLYDRLATSDCGAGAGVGVTYCNSSRLHFSRVSIGVPPCNYVSVSDLYRSGTVTK